MISGLKIGNFKAFGPAQEIPLRPLTLVFGPNSAGKSSIIQSLLLARHIQDTGNVDAHQTTLGGGAVDLGGFARYVHSRHEERELSLHFSIKRDDLAGNFHDLNDFGILTLGYAFRGTRTAPQISSITVSMDGNVVRCLAPADDGVFRMQATPITNTNPLSRCDDWDRVKKQLAANFVTLDPQKIVDMAVNAGLSAADVVDSQTGKPIMSGCLDLAERAFSKVRTTLEENQQALGQEQKRALVEELTSANIKIEGLAMRILNPLPRTGFYTTDDMTPEEQDADSDPERFFAHFVKAGGRLDHVAAIQRYYEMGVLSRDERDAEQHPQQTPESLAMAMRFMVERLLEAANETLANDLCAMSYLGPLRWIPPRFIPDGEQFDASWKAGGGEAWQRLRREPELLERVNHFLRESLRTRYRLECLHFARVRAATAPAGNAPPDPVSARIAEDPPPAPTPRVPSADETITTLSIVDADTGLSVSHRDVGTGISYVMPVLVNAAGAKERLIMIEEPELHLHPAHQAELSDVFIESALGPNKNTFLIETHSEHLILRLLRRIRETAAGDLSPGAIPVRPEHVAVLYVKPGAEGSEVIELPVNDEGDFDRPWPDGFFPERAKELF